MLKKTTESLVGKKMFGWRRPRLINTREEQRLLRLLRLLRRRESAGPKILGCKWCIERKSASRFRDSHGLVCSQTSCVDSHASVLCSPAECLALHIHETKVLNVQHVPSAGFHLPSDLWPAPEDRQQTQPRKHWVKTATRAKTGETFLSPNLISTYNCWKLKCFIESNFVCSSLFICLKRFYFL